MNLESIEPRFHFDLAVNPVPLGRPRTVLSALGKARTYTPPRSEQFVEDFRTVLLGQRPRPRTPLTGPLSLMLRFWRQHPGGSRGDLDNMAKAVLDAGNGVLWADDKQIEHVDMAIAAAGPKVQGRIILAIRPAPTVDEHEKARKRMRRTLERVSSLTALVPETAGTPLQTTRLDEVHAAMRQWLELVCLDLGDPAVIATVVRVLDFLLIEGAGGTDITREHIEACGLMDHIAALAVAMTTSSDLAAA